MGWIYGWLIWKNRCALLPLGLSFLLSFCSALLLFFSSGLMILRPGKQRRQITLCYYLFARKRCLVFKTFWVNTETQNILNRHIMGFIYLYISYLDLLTSGFQFNNNLMESYEKPFFLPSLLWMYCPHMQHYLSSCMVNNNKSSVPLAPLLVMLKCTTGVSVELKWSTLKQN